MENTKHKIDELIRDGYDFKFGDYISQGFNIVNKNIGGFIGYTLVFYLIMIGLGIIPIIGSIALLVLIYPLMVGYYIVAHKINNGESVEFGNFFDGTKRISDLLLLMGLLIVINIVAALPFFLVMGSTFMEIIELSAEPMQDPEEILALYSNMNFGLLFLTYIPMIYLSVAYTWAAPLVLFNNMRPWEAMEASRKVINKKWLWVFGFIVVMGFIGAAGAILLLVGMLYTIPVYMCGMYAAYADVIGVDNGEDDVIDHLVG